MREGGANERQQLLEDYAEACAEYDAASALVVRRREDANNKLDATPTAAEARAEQRARYTLVALRRRVCQSGGQYLESLPIG
jgi:hypothetical protein